MSGRKPQSTPPYHTSLGVPSLRDEPISEADAKRNIDLTIYIQINGKREKKNKAYETLYKDLVSKKFLADPDPIERNHIDIWANFFKILPSTEVEAYHQIRQIIDESPEDEREHLTKLTQWYIKNYSTESEKFKKTLEQLEAERELATIRDQLKLRIITLLATEGRTPTEILKKVNSQKESGSNNEDNHKAVELIRNARLSQAYQQLLAEILADQSLTADEIIQKFIDLAFSQTENLTKLLNLLRKAGCTETQIVEHYSAYIQVLDHKLSGKIDKQTINSLAQASNIRVYDFISILEEVEKYLKEKRVQLDQD